MLDFFRLLLLAGATAAYSDGITSFVDFVNTRNSQAWSHSTNFTCYVGIYSTNTVKSYGSTVYCNGLCGSARSTVGDQNVTAFLCLDSSICTQLNVNGNCTSLPSDKDITACCCNDANNCNVALANLDTTITPPPVVNTTDPPIACYTGFWANGASVVDGGYQVCQGDCVSVTLNSTVNNVANSATIYTCDPSTYCRNYNILGNCSTIDTGMGGCCCNSDVCIDPIRGINPTAPLVCFAGVWVKEDNYTQGDDVACNGMCASVQTTVSGKTVKVYQCVRQDVCTNGLNIDGDGCTTFLSNNVNVTSCCCESGNNCNSANDNLNINIPMVNMTGTPIACWSGFYMDGIAQGTPGWTTCKGDCASFQWQTTNNGATMTLFTCDPVQFINTLNASTHCGPIDNLSGLKVCSCQTSGCLDGSSNVPKTQAQLYCYVGLQTTAPNSSYGAQVACNGKCGSAIATLNGLNTTSFFCLDPTICNALGLNNACGPLPGDKDVTGCCCDNGNSCNIAQANVTLSSPPVNQTFTDPPIACFTGIDVDGQLLSSTYQSCLGDCVSIRLETKVNGANHSATLYTCDPSTYCRNYGILGNCSTIEDGMTGCCCSTDVCIDPTRNKFPGRKLTCYVGIQTDFPNKTTGQTVYCDGKCGSATTVLQDDSGKNYSTTSFFCLDNSVCSALGLDNQCQPMPGDKEVMGCCCDNMDNCNIGQAATYMPTPVTSVPNVTDSTDPKIACYAGVWINGNALMQGKFMSCQGDCASITLNTKVNGANHTATLYTCDPSTFCRSVGILGGCSQIEPGMTGCCCNTDSCIDPTRNKVPVSNLTCYVGLQTGFPGKTYGSTVPCSGKCGSATAVLAGYQTTTFFCLDSTICSNLQLDNSCSGLPGDKDVTGCCCDNDYNCNVKQANMTFSPPAVTNNTDPRIACYAGVWLDGVPVNGGGTFTACQGDCVSITLNTNVSNVPHSATLYTCDPSYYCTQFNMTNSCNSIEPGMDGCCCNTDSCIDPTRNKTPRDPLTCYVGVQSDLPGKSSGSTVFCNGKCGSAITTLQDTNGKNYNTTSFFCMDNSVCKTLALDNACLPLPGDKDVLGCCCDNGAACNVAQAAPFMSNPVTSVPNATVSTDPRIACYAGVWVDGQPVQDGVFTACQGDCVSITFNSKVNGANHTATLYTCDPSSFCRSFDILGKCSQIEPGMTGCCCNTDSCIDPTRNKSPARGLTCYVGLQTDFPDKTYGSTVPCDGKCASAQAILAGYKTTTFFCLDSGTCSTLGLDNSCGSMPGDKDITGCCCDNDYNCNIAQANFGGVITAPPVVNNTDPRIACYSGVWVNGAPLGPGTYQACQGNCVSITLNTTVDKTPHYATLFTCDPSYYCRQFGMANQCANIEPGMKGCCCDSDSCIDPTRNRSPDNPLTCYVGIQTDFANKTYGSTVYCSGKCGSASTTLASYNISYNITTFFCFQDNGICSALGLDNSCAGMPGDKEVTGCCCDNNPNCNIAQAGLDGKITAPVVVPYDDPMIACYSGVWVNGQPLANGTYLPCQGDCVSITLNTSVNNNNHTASIYTCDPSSYCKRFDILGKCSPIEPGMDGCCCNTDVCIDPTKNRSPNNPLVCFAGVYVKEDNYTLGQDVNCDGKCISIQTMVSSKTVKVYQCAARTVCTDGLGIDDNGCTTFKEAGTDVSACCCDDSTNCNTKNDNLTYVIPSANWTSIPIACLSGFFKNGKAQGTPTWSTCFGYCVSFQWKYSNSSDTMTLYTCDPVQFVQSLNVDNKCSSVDNMEGLKVCSCNSQGCLTGDSNIPNDIQTTTPSSASRSDLWFLVSLSLLTIFLRQ